MRRPDLGRKEKPSKSVLESEEHSIAILSNQESLISLRDVERAKGFPAAAR